MVNPIVVVGDAMLDVDRTGSAERLSPEAPVPVLRNVTQRQRPGGAALAAALAATVSDRPVVLIAPFADDEPAARIRALLGDLVSIVALPWTGTTPVKTRLRIGQHPVARIDEGGSPGAIGALPNEVAEALATAAAVLVADYGNGITADRRVRAALSAVVGRGLNRTPVVWDPHPRGASAVPGATLATPNEAELLALTGSAATAAPSIAALHAAADELSRRWQTSGVCVTRGARGAMLVHRDNPPLLTAAAEVFGGDTCGAGDCFSAALTAGLAGGALPSEAVPEAVAAASRFVAAGGAAAFDPHVAPDLGAPTVDALLARIRASGGTVVATGGCFDLLHAGHIATLEAARALGNCLVVCLNSDDSVRRLKGPRRPLQPAPDRARVLAALQCVDAVVVFEEDTPSTVLRRIRPDIWAKGGDYAGLPLPEAAVLAEWGGEAVVVPYLRGRSTTALVELAARPSAAAPNAAR